MDSLHNSQSYYSYIGAFCLFEGGLDSINIHIAEEHPESGMIGADMSYFARAGSWKGRGNINSLYKIIRQNFVSQMAEWLRRQIRMIIDLSDGVSPRRFKSCSGSGLFWKVFLHFLARPIGSE